MNATSQAPLPLEAAPAGAAGEEALVRQAEELAADLQRRAGELQTRAERRQQAELARLLRDPEAKALLAQLTDQAFRSSRPARVADQLRHLLATQGIPAAFGPWERALLRGFQAIGALAPGIAVPLVKAYLRRRTAQVILPAEPARLAQLLRQRRAAGVRINVNLLGEAILGEGEAARRLLAILELLQRPEIEVVSVKISTLYPHIAPLARAHTVAVLCERLERLYRAAAELSCRRPDGTRAPKFLYLDMEEYRDMALTAEAFMRTLERPGLAQVGAGLALQAYIPDAFPMQQRLNAWARARVAAGGAPVTLRLVKGANLEMERVEAAVRGWPQAPYPRKVETDANYKRMLQEGLRPENLAAVRLGVASHNLFDLAYALVLATAAGAGDRVQFEMLAGMADHQQRALRERTRDLLLYAPVCRPEHFIHAIGYLLRRLDENTGPDNFLRHAFRLRAGDAEWRQLAAGFRAAFRLLPALPAAPRRTQDRLQAGRAAPRAAPPRPPFVNEPDTDFALPANGVWAQRIIATWQPQYAGRAAALAPVIAGDELHEGRSLCDCRDPSRPGAVVGRYPPATEADIDRALACARADPDGWRALGLDQRADILGRVAQEIRQARGDLIGAALANGGKTIPEADPEVSEAVDFCGFYGRAARAFHELPGVASQGQGVVVVVAPWNFPISIPCGGVAAALAAGNTVILKPASDAVLVAWELCRCFWRAGVSKKVLQFAPCPGAGPGRRLVSSPAVDAVILTGGTATALAMLQAAPAMHLYAETGGKNATIVTALADREQAIRHVLQSAFSHGGQKCSATSLLLLEAEVYDDAHFREALCDAVASLRVGSAWELPTQLGPLIRPPAGDLARGLTALEPGEAWAVRPQPAAGNPQLWTPGVKWGVRPGSFTHLTELFGPVLGVMRFETLPEAIALVNATGYGLTSGLESLDDREQAIWQAGLRAGNLYINRPTTGAIVLRQPFGGMGKSCFGPGLKAGGPNYVAQFMHFTSRPGTIADAVADCAQFQRTELAQAHDPLRLLGQDNFRRYRPVQNLCVRVQADDSAFDTVVRVVAAETAGCRVTVSAPPALATGVRALLAPHARAVDYVSEDDPALAARIARGAIERIRYAAPGRVPAAIRAAAANGTCICDAPVVGAARVEMLWCVREQSVSCDYHRYGNLGRRAAEPRTGVL